ncbi:MAG: hypothetical protein KC978_23045, partial [Candidatus Omnitrophica bacterium]|nr:hypothetical protein [Candidatus Omnitrophota bacterium]
MKNLNSILRVSGCGKVFPLSTMLVLLVCSDGFTQSQESVPQLEEPATAIMMDPVFTPGSIATSFHMTPRFFYDGRVLKPGDFDFDLGIGTMGTDFDETENGLRIQEDSEMSYYLDLGYRIGLAETLGPLDMPSEIYTQLPILFGDQAISTQRLDAGLNSPI